jgi:type I restriction enzyme R subunit
MIRDFINDHKKSDDPNYCVRVTASEGERGDQWLRVFRDNEKTIPTILTTSQKLSTGVDARNLRFVVLMRPVGSMVEFKQIVGRGTRVYEGKDYFTIVDFYDNYTKFDDPEWDGEAVEITEPEPPIGPGEDGGDDEGGIIVDPPLPPIDPPPPPKQKVKIQLAPHRVVFMDDMVETLYFDGEGNAVSPEQFLKDLFEKLPDFFVDEESLRKIWSNQETRNKLIDELADRGFDLDKLLKLRDVFSATDSDIYDLLRFIKFDKQVISRKMRVDTMDKSFIDGLDEKNREFVDFILKQYEHNGFEEFNDLTNLLNLKYGNTSVVDELGGVDAVRNTFSVIQEAVYSN